MAEPPPHVYRVTGFNDMAVVGDAFNAGERVEFSVEGAERDVARRAVDFATGMVYATQGSMYRIAEDRYVMEPPSAVEGPQRHDE